MSAKQLRRSLSRTRIAAMTSLLIIFFGATSVLVGVFPHDSIGAVVAFVVGLILTPSSLHQLSGWSTDISITVVLQ